MKHLFRRFNRLVPAFLLAIGLLAAAAPAAAEALSSDTFARLAVLEGGRHKPLDSYAWESIRGIHGKSHLKDAQGKRWEPIDLVLDIAARPDHWRTQKLIRIDFFGLKEKLGFPTGEKYFSFDEIVSKPELGTLIDEARRLNADASTSTKLSTETQTLYNRLVVLDELLSGHGFRLIPDPRDRKAAWLNPLEASPQSAQAWGMLMAAWSSGDAFNFNQAVGELQGLIRQTAGADYPTEGTIAREIRYNRLQPFHKAWELYGLLALTTLLAAALAGFSIKDSIKKGLGWLNTGLVLVALAFHTSGLYYITILTGRAPISNLFESMVFIIWAMILLAAVFHFLSKRENYLVMIAGVLGAISMGYALDSTIDISINPLVPVLRSYWLNIHVTIITFSYGAFAVAAGLGHAYLWKYRGNPGDVSTLNKIDKLSYRVLGIGVVTLTAGIILGAVWANESWGRYWGWDPKETWSLITLLFYVAMIHGRMNGWISKRNTAVLNIAGLAVVLMTYFGVNYYLTGLHSYATGNPEPFPLKLLIYVALEIAFVLFCLWDGKRKSARPADPARV
jgi:cytochrome c-type biogenesis protein CcsB